ncbi:MAG: energy transducer TonB [Bacteroidetes bacterium]|nr:energy transducer TonB [Bacteroidota bacterium]
MTYVIVIVVLLVLSLLLTLDGSWMNVLQRVRNNLVFADRNKAYGAYELRTDYNRRLGLALVCGVAFFAVVIGAPYLINKLGSSVEKEEAVKIVDVNLDNYQEQPEEPPPPPEVIPPPQPQIETVQFVAVEAADEPVNEPPPTQADLTETTAGETTQEGERIDAPPPPPPVEEETYDLAAVQEQPDFPGGMAQMYAYLKKTTKYPDMEFEAGIQGKVYVEFVVDKDGSVEEVKVKRGVSPGLDKEALRAVQSMPKWSPGKMNGKAVKCRFTIPVDFKLQ